MRARHSRFLVLALVAVGLGAGLAGVAVSRGGWLTWLEQRSVDGRFSVRGSRPAPKTVVVVALDNRSLEVLANPPIPRAVDATVIRRLYAAGARAVAFDFSLERPRSDRAGDRAVVAALASGPSVVSVTRIHRDGSVAPLAGRRPIGNRSAVRPGYTMLPLDTDGASRRFPSGLGGVPAFAAAAAGRYRSVTGPPLPSPAGALIDFPGPAGTVRALSFNDVYRGDFDAALVRNRVVVVGPTSPVLADIHRTSADAAMSGPEIQAAATATALAGFPLRQVARPTTTIVLLLVGVLLPSLMLAIAGLRAVRGHRELEAALPGTVGVIGLGAALLLAWVVACQVAFENGRVIDLSAGALTMALSALGCWMAATWLERRERRRLRELFAEHRPGVVDHVLGTPGAPTGLVTPSDVIAGYRIQAELGRGGMGVVYRAEQERLQRPVALKLIRPEYAEDATFRARFERESRLAAGVNHPNVIPVFDFGDDDGLLYLAMQVVDGVDLGAALRVAGRLDPAYATRIVSQVAAALDAAHRVGLIHRDVKPGNILITEDDVERVYLTDFGLARSTGASAAITQGEGWLGTLDYMAPEQIEGASVDGRTDTYALTATLYRCLAGEVPFPREDVRAKLLDHLEGDRPRPTSLRSELPAAIDAVIARGMAVDPAGRFATAGEMAAAACLAVGEAVASTPAPRPGETPASPPAASHTAVTPELPHCDV